MTASVAALQNPVVFPPPRPSPSLTGDETDGDTLDYNSIRAWASMTVEPMEKRLERYTDYFTVPVSHLRLMVDAFEHELHLGLDMFSCNPHVWDPAKCSFKMLDSCVPEIPTGRETGIYYALDFGGTNFRAVRAELLGNNSIRRTQYRMSLADAQTAQRFPRGLMDERATAADMFNFFASCCRELMEQEGDVASSSAKQTSRAIDSDTTIAAGFTFSFPCSQRRVDSAVLIEWTKGFQTGRATNDPVEGLDVVQLTDAAFRRLDVPLNVACVVNDTVGTLLSCAYEMPQRQHPPCLIGMILGTGVNACYYEKDAPAYGYKGHVINIECGNFNRELPLSNVDDEVDFAEVGNRGRQRLEKMIAGAYLGEICRRAIVKVLQHLAPEAAWKPYSFGSEDVSLVIEDSSSDLSTTASVMRQVWNATFSEPELRAVNQLCKTIVARSAALAAVIIAGTARKTQYLQPAMQGVSVAIDGSLYKCVPFFRNKLRAALEDILGSSRANLIHLLTADDGSGKGAAVLACTVAHLTK